MRNASLLFGLGFILLGFYLFNNPLAAVGSVAWILAFYILMSGIQNLRRYLSLPSQYRSLMLLVQAVGSIFLGLSLVAGSSFVRSNLLLTFVGFWLVFIGILAYFGKRQSYSAYSRANKSWVFLLIGLVFLIAPIYSSVFIGKLLSLICFMIGGSALLFQKQNF